MKFGVVRMNLELVSPLQIGSGALDPLLDAPVFRDAFGDYRIPGSSLAGAVRAFAQNTALDSLFGQGGQTSDASAVEFSDGFLVDWDGDTFLRKRLRCESPAMPRVLEVQDRVRIDHTSGTAAIGGKFDAEIVPQGLRFRVEIACVDRGRTDESLNIPEVLGSILDWFKTGSIRLGAGVTNGLGVVCPVAGTVSHAVYDLATPEGLIAARVMPSAITESLGESGDISETVVMPNTKTASVIDGVLQITFRVDGPILVGGSQRPRPSGNESATADLLFGHALVADYANKEFVSRPWIPGSSVKGVLRHRVHHVLEAVGREDAERCVDEWFGSVGDHGASASHVSVRGHVLDDEKPTIVQHVAIDRLTGGSLQGALYSEAPIWKDGLRVDVTFELNCLPVDGAVALAHAVLDMGTGSLPIGGGGNRGNGRLVFSTEGDSMKAFYGRAVQFDIVHDGQRYKHTDAPVDLQGLRLLFDNVNLDGTGRHPSLQGERS